MPEATPKPSNDNEEGPDFGGGTAVAEKDELTQVPNQKPEPDLSLSPEPSGEGPSDSKPPAPPLAAEAHKPHAPVTAVVIAVIILLALAAVTVFAYMKNKDTAPAETNQITQSQATPATVEDVDNTNAAIDKDLSTTDENQDFNNDDVSDQTLGL